MVLQSSNLIVGATQKTRGVSQFSLIGLSKGYEYCLSRNQLHPHTSLILCQLSFVSTQWLLHFCFLCVSLVMSYLKKKKARKLMLSDAFTNIIPVSMFKTLGEIADSSCDLQTCPTLFRLGLEFSASICLLGTERSFGSSWSSKAFAGPHLGSRQCWIIEGRSRNVKNGKEYLCVPVAKSLAQRLNLHLSSVVIHILSYWLS